MSLIVVHSVLSLCHQPPPPPHFQSCLNSVFLYLLYSLLLKKKLKLINSNPMEILKLSDHRKSSVGARTHLSSSIENSYMY